MVSAGVDDKEKKIHLHRALVLSVIIPVVEDFTLNFDGLQIGKPLNVVRTSCLVIRTYKEKTGSCDKRI